MDTKLKAATYTRTSLTSEKEHIDAEIAKLGRTEFLRKVSAASRRAIADLPDSAEVNKLDSISRRYIESIGTLIETGLRGADWNDSELVAFANDVSWAKLAADAIAVAMDNSGGGGVTPATK